MAYLQYGVFQELREQRLAEEQQQRERRERDAMRQQKEKPQTCSANASTEVKQKLQVRTHLYFMNFTSLIQSLYHRHF